QQRHVMEPDLAGRQRRELRIQIRRRRKHHADHIVSNQPVPGHYFGDQLSSPLQNVRLLVGVHLHGPPDSPNRHQHSLHPAKAIPPRLSSPTPPPPPRITPAPTPLPLPPPC